MGILKSQRIRWVSYGLKKNQIRTILKWIPDKTRLRKLGLDNGERIALPRKSIIVRENIASNRETPRGIMKAVI